MDRVPREAKVASLLLNASGVNECEPKVIQQLLEFMYRMGSLVDFQRLISM